jgi:hypothetical protein
MRFDVLKNKLMQLEDLSIKISDLVEKNDYDNIPSIDLKRKKIINEIQNENLKSYKNKINEIINMNNLAMHTLENALSDVKKQSIQKLDCFEAYKK